MRLYLMQHGEAVERSVSPDRPLSERGRRDVERVSQFLAATGIRIAMVMHSEKTRARETAEILARHVKGALAERDALRPDDDVAHAVQYIESAIGDVAIVGHLPHLSLLAANLIRTKGKGQPISFQRGGIAAFEPNDEGLWQILWIVVPELLPT